MNPRRVVAGRLKQEFGRELPFVFSDMVRLSVMIHHVPALRVFDPVDILTMANHLAAGGHVLAGDEVEQRGFAGAIGADDGDYPGPLHFKIRLQLKDDMLAEPALGMHFGEILDMQIRR